MEQKDIEKMSVEEIQKLASNISVTDVISMANSIYSNYGNYFGTYTPNLMNQNLNSLNNNPMIPNKQSLNNALLNYKYKSEDLKAFTEYAEAWDILYERTINYYANMLSYDLQISCTNAYLGKADYESKEYKEDKRRVYKFLDNFDYKDEFKKVTKNLLRNEIYYTWFRDSQGTFDSTGDIDVGDKVRKLSSYTLQMLPQQRCLLTGTWENGLLFDFDMTYFLKAGVDINSYDPCFKKYWRNVFGDNNNPTYNPTAKLNNRDGTFAMWTQTSPDDGAWAFKFSMDNFNSRPFLSSLIRMVLSNDEMKGLQNDANMLMARAILAGQIPMLDKQKSGNITNAMAWKPETLTNFMKLVKMGLIDNVNAVAMPTEQNDFYQFDGKDAKDMLSYQYKWFAGNGASANRMIYSDDKMSKDEIENAIITDYNIVRRVYPQFRKFLNFYVNKKTRKYKFDFNIDGCSYLFIRDKDKKNLLDLASNGIVLNSNSYAKIVDMTPQQFDRSLEEGKYSDWINQLSTMLMNVHTQSGKDNSGAVTDKPTGQPPKDDSEISENGAISQNYK